MTLDVLPGSFRPGAATTPQPLPGVSGSGVGEAYHLQFLSAEERATAVLTGYFTDARLELEAFIRTGDLTVSDATFYRQLLDETNRISGELVGDGSRWVSSVIPEAYSAGWRTNSSIVMPKLALEALSRSTLDLITSTSLGIRTAVRQAIAQGILQGLSGSDVRARILATGLTNIPHWPSVDYRAGVIARTETMTAYNAGIIAGIESTGALFVRWIISPDEAVCPICAPRARNVYRLSGAPDGGPLDPWGPAALPLPRIPAHPRCRCTVRAEYRDPNGNVVRQGVPEVAPKLPTDAMGGNLPPIVPPAAGDFAQAIARLGNYAKTDVDDWFTVNRLRSLLNAEKLADLAALEARLDVTFWRSLGQLSPDEIRMLSTLSGRTGNVAYSNFLSLRYGITWGKPLGWTPELRQATISALERIRAIVPRYVVDSPYLSGIGMAPTSASRFGANTIARAFPTGEVQGNMKLWQTFVTRSLRSGEATGAEEVILHEFMHTVHFRYGLYDTALTGSRYNYRAAESVLKEWHDEYNVIRRSTQSIVAPDSIEKLRIQAAEFRKQGEDLAKLFGGDPLRSSAGSSWIRRAEEIEKTIVKIEQGGAELYPTDYAKQSVAEDFAESGMLYFLNPARLRRYSPRRYEFFRDRVFAGWEPA